MFKPKGVIFLTVVIMLMAFSCSDTKLDQPLLTAKHPIHLEEHLDAARIEGSEVPKDTPAAVKWRFDEPQPDWKPVIPLDSSIKPVRTTLTEDALRLFLTKANRGPHRWSPLFGGIYIDLPDWRRGDWAYILVRARTTGKAMDIRTGFILREHPGPTPLQQGSFRFDGEYINVINDGSVHTYLMQARYSWRKWDGSWKQLGITVYARDPTSIDILSVSVIPKEAIYSDTHTGVRTEVRSQAHRRTLYTHAPGKLEYRVRIPKAGRLDFGLGVLWEDSPVTFRVTVVPEGGIDQVLFEEIYADQNHWGQRTVDLTLFEKKTVKLTLETGAERAGTVALWTAPTLTGKRTTNRPNIIFYIIDGATKNAMSVYGYNRRTTPNLNRLAAEGAVFENAYSNSSWTKPSTPSFMTSLHNSVLGGYRGDSDPLPEQVVTMAQHMHNAGYQTGVFTSTAYCGTMSGLDRGVDVLREAGVETTSRSSEELHKDFWRWREAYTGEPYWVHFQTTDVHPPYKPVAPFAGLFVEPEMRKRYSEWKRQLGRLVPLDEQFEKNGISRLDYFNTVRGIYDEAMAHNDYQIGRLVERLKASGEWERTLLIIAADHGTTHIARVIDPWPRERSAFSYTYLYGIPMIIIWPGHILSNQSFSQPVSMIDMLPTILDLAGLPMPEVMQGQSLASLLLGKEGWEPGPVILDEFEVDEETAELSGRLEMIDSRWIASLRISAKSQREDQPPEKRKPPLRLYDLWNNPIYGGSVHEQRPDLVEKYTELLKAKWKAHRELAKHFSRSGEAPLTPEQLRTLRSLGYIK